MSMHELQILRALLSVARCLGCFPFSFPTRQQATAGQQASQTQFINSSMNGYLSIGFQRSYLWTAILKLFIVSLLYTTSHLVALLYSRILTTLHRKPIDPAVLLGNHRNKDCLIPMSIHTRETQRETAERLLALHEAQHHINDFFSYSVILVLAESLICCTSLIFYITSKMEILPLNTMSYMITWESISTIIFTCCTPDLVQKQKCGVMYKLQFLMRRKTTPQLQGN
ncbi:hypothetical protein E2C01_023925 [Portunus trituberculatus]|uniref:Uncharacterized protein n=1 Tax=Portunus trituberculatus TaxID=210409 RepID=A0A5B7EBA1_PORTR|nr:hypothetical protein [Portunus trituberculatus]